MGYYSLLLELKHVREENSFSFDQHLKFLPFLLDAFGNSWDDVPALIVGCWNFNRSFSRRAVCIFGGCFIHRYNLAVQHVIKEQASEIDFMRKWWKTYLIRSSLEACAKLRALKAKQDNAVGWSSTLETLKRYLDLHEIWRSSKFPEDNDFATDSSKYRGSAASDNKDVRSWFSYRKCAIPVFPYSMLTFFWWGHRNENFCSKFERQPQTKVKPVDNPFFESGVVNVQDGNESTIMLLEKKSVQHILSSPVRSKERD